MEKLLTANKHKSAIIIKKVEQKITKLPKLPTD